MKRESNLFKVLVLNFKISLSSLLTFFRAFKSGLSSLDLPIYRFVFQPQEVRFLKKGVHEEKKKLETRPVSENKRKKHKKGKRVE